jgi:hypothetical protein
VVEVRFLEKRGRRGECRREIFLAPKIAPNHHDTVLFTIYLFIYVDFIAVHITN